MFISNSDNLGAVPDPRVAGWFAGSGAPFAIEAVRRTASDRKGGFFARRKIDGRLVLRETAQTPPEDAEAAADLDRHRYCSTNNVWFDLAAMKQALDVRQGILGLPLIRNVKNVDPADPSSPKVIQVETAMGAAIEIFENSRLIEVGRDRFVPVKTTDDLLVLRSDVYEIGGDFVLDQVAAQIPYVDLDDDYYKVVGEFDKRFPEGAPVDAEGHLAADPGRLDVRAGRADRRRRRARRLLRGAGAGERCAHLAMPDELVSVEEHLARILDDLAPLPAAEVPLMDALGLSLAEDVTSGVSLPRLRQLRHGRVRRPGRRPRHDSGDAPGGRARSAPGRQGSTCSSRARSPRS